MIVLRIALAAVVLLCFLSAACVIGLISEGRRRQWCDCPNCTAWRTKQQ